MIVLGISLSYLQIEELVHWEQTCQKRKVKQEFELSPIQLDDRPTDMLIRFLQAVKESNGLLAKFQTKISQPLFDFFNDDPKSPLTKAMSSVLWRWESLLVPGSINHRLFSPKSADALYNMGVKMSPNDSQFNLILRFIPDLALKAFEALCIAKQWRSNLGPWGYIRELRYIQSKWIPEKRAEFDQNAAIEQRRQFEIASCRDQQVSLQTKLRDTEHRLIDSSIDMDETEKTAGALSHIYKDAHLRINNMRRDFKTANAQRGTLARELSKQKDYIIMLQEEMKREQKDVQNIRAQLIQAGVNLKYLDEREMTKLLQTDLEDSVVRCTHLRKEITKAEDQYNDRMTVYHSTCERLNSVRSRIDTAKSQRFSVTTRLLQSRDQHRQFEKSFTKAADSFHLLKEELRKNKLVKQVLLRQMLQPRQPQRPMIKPLILS